MIRTALAALLAAAALTVLRVTLSVRPPRTDQRGASAVEYGLLCAAVLLLCIGGAKVLGLTLGTVFASENSRVSVQP